jgi:hypothetical protein
MVAICLGRHPRGVRLVDNSYTARNLARWREPWHCLEKVDLTEQGFQDYCFHGTDTVVEQPVVPVEPPTTTTTTPDMSHNDPQTRFFERRTQIVEWAAQMESGGSQIDANQRLVLNRGPDPLPPIPRIVQQQQQQGGVNHHNNHNNAGGVPGGIPLLLEIMKRKREGGLRGRSGRQLR